MTKVSGMKKLMRLLILLIPVGAIGVFGWWFFYARGEQKSIFLTAKVERGELSTTINATGTIEPEQVIDIGAQVLGMIKEFGRDPKNTEKFIDYGSHVEPGTVLARIDESLYRAAVEQASSNFRLAEANLRLAEANLYSMKSKLEQTRRDWERIQPLKTKGAISDADYDTAKNAYETAEAAVHGAEASVEAAKGSVEVNRAALKTAQINLDYCTIVAPVKGVIVDRRVNIGQTVVASLSAPSLFLLAKDLTRLQVWASVNEADIGQIHPGQSVTFRVAAFPNERFRGTVVQIRLNATMTQNVVTYTVVVGVDNTNERLLPYMTANLDFQIEHRDSALRLSSAAFRWQPAPHQIAPVFRGDSVASAPVQPLASAAHSAEGGKGDYGRVWVPDGFYVRPIDVRVGITDGALTEIVGGELEEGTVVVVGEAEANSSANASNPFAPQLPRPK
jgi:HlyD family secretion protein